VLQQPPGRVLHPHVNDRHHAILAYAQGTMLTCRPTPE
jgi:hypothetical protein